MPRRPVPADYETLELLIIPIALFAAIASLIRTQELWPDRRAVAQ